MHKSSFSFILLFPLLFLLLLNGCAKTEQIVEPSGSLELLQQFSVKPDDDHAMYQPAALTPDGIVLISYDDYPDTEAAVLYDLETGKKKRTYSTSSLSGISKHRAVAVSPDGKYLAIAGVYKAYGSAFAVWDLADGTMKWSPTAGPSKGEILCLKFNDDGTQLAIGGAFGVVVWDVEGSRQKYELKADYFRTVTAIEFSPTGDTVLSSPPGYWSVPEKKLVEDFDDTRGYFATAVFIDGGSKVLAALWELFLFNRDDPEQIGLIHNYSIDDSFDDPEVKSTRFLSLAASADRELVAAGDIDGKIDVLRGTTGALIGSGRTVNPVEVTALSFSAFDPTLLAASTATGSIYVWRIHQ